MLRSEELAEDAEDAKRIVTKILELSGCSDIFITGKGNIYVRKKGTSEKEFVFYKPSSIKTEVFESHLLFPTHGRECSWRDLEPREVQSLVLESLSGCFFGIPGNRPLEVAFIPEASSIAELGLKIDMLDSILVSYSDFYKMSGMPRWLREAENELWS